MTQTVSPWRWRVMVEPWIRPGFRLYARVFRGLQVDVIGLVQNAEGEILLMAGAEPGGLSLIKGPVSRRGDPEAALRSALETAGVEMLARPMLLSVRRPQTPGADHEIIYLVKAWRPRSGSSALAAWRWSPPDALPEDTRPC